MLTSIVPKLPMRKKDRTLQYYVDLLHFDLRSDYGDYLIVGKDEIEIHFFLLKISIQTKIMDRFMSAPTILSSCTGIYWSEI